MFCLGCDYPLERLKSYLSPECGRAFDSEDVSTYRYVYWPVLDNPVMLTRRPVTDAVVLCVRLEGAGILAMTHEERGGVIAYSEQPQGSVWVERKDEPQARAVIAQPSSAADRALWRCAACGEMIEGQFALCWNCGAERG